MKIFYATSKGHRDVDLEITAVKTIPELLKATGREVTIFAYDPTQADSDTGFEEITQLINSADIFIGEMSRASQTLGFQLAYALSRTKPSLYLYHSSRTAKPDSSLVNHSSRLLKVSAYNDDTIRRVLNSFINYAETQLLSTRTSFMSTRSIDEYLNNAAKKMGVSKGEVIRQLLQESMKNQ